MDDDGDGSVTGDDIRRRAEAKLRGTTDEHIEFEEVGFAIIEE